ncbi:Protein CBG20967 [Caenorhabditis briggsae]|uniref:Protein CBG20967 n=1 Tax=Caenorhabditis briggsae TaxID=6238 RepID=A8XZ25_CAEBR|nr:Protein CBG20967 [Caenorhabditis briggsae]CAP37892.2 Protein CBG20967 [Caenorhabditis briggsae]
MGLLTIIGNSVILYLFFTKRLDSRRNLRIILYMAVTDILFAVMIMPQICYMIYNWDTNFVNYDPYVIAAIGWPLPLFLKACVGLNAGAATERILALYFPIIYRKVDHVQCSNILMIICMFIGGIDVVMSTCSFHFEPRVNCSSLGCFVNDIFRTYWGTSNMACGLVVIVMSLFVFIKVQKLSRESGWMGSTPAERKQNMAASQKFTQANRTTCGILLSSLLCMTIPSLLVSLVETITGFSIFEKFGAFYVASLLTNGAANCLIFLILNGPVKSKINTKTLSDAVTTVASSKPYNSSKQTTFVDLT